MSRKTITQWKSDGRIVMIGNLVDAAASRALVDETTGSLSKKRRGVRAKVTEPARVTGKVTTYDPDLVPKSVSDIAWAIDSGAFDLAALLLPATPIDRVKAIVAEWVAAQRRAWVGGKGLPASEADCGWPSPPPGFTRWSDHPLFTEGSVSDADWIEIEAEAGRPAA
ncbi:MULTISPECIES: hypothetical protein [Acidiphilium]|uniref:hypothetical protein n=1 Tax=Acidiphilium TaxID=522 RepID=UPI0025860C0F|nr:MULTISPECIES: hypothetical protein [Acidiphilium]HQT86361.1 hypothetical protein [Acidiphilium rubrum]